jgi:hypothetical protein
MNMGFAPSAFKKAADKDFISAKNSGTDRTYPVAFAAQTAYTAAYVHKTIFAAIEGREGMGTHQLPFDEFHRAHRASLRISWRAFSRTFAAASPAETEAAYAAQSRRARAEKQGVAEPEQYHSYHQKDKNFKEFSHSGVLAIPP